MTGASQPDSSEPNEWPGKLRTMWHPLFVRMLDYTLGSAYSVREEVSVGKMPLRVDILLIRRESGQVVPTKAGEISALLPLLNRFTLIEFKGPTDVMERGDFGQLVGCAFLWHSQESESIPHEEVSLVVVAPTVNNALREDLRLYGLEISQHERGIFRVTGLPFAVWLVETDAMAERGEPVFSLISRVFANDGRRIIKELVGTGHGRLASFAAQQIGRLYRREDFTMQFADSEKLAGFDDEVLDEILKWVPAEERVRGLAPEERLAGMSDEEIARLSELIEQRKRNPNRHGS